MRELLLLLFGQYVRPTGGPHAYEVIHELLACQPVFLQEQFDNMRTRVNIFWWNVIEAEHRRDQVYEEHKAILDAMAAGDEAGALDASFRHSRITLEVLFERFSFEE